MSSRQDVALCNTSSLKHLDSWLIVDRLRFSGSSLQHTPPPLPPPSSSSSSPSPLSTPSSSSSVSRCPIVLDGGFSVRLHHPTSRLSPADGSMPVHGCDDRPVDVRLEQRCFVSQRPDHNQLKLTFKAAAGVDCRLPIEFESTSSSVNSSKSSSDVVVGLSCVAEWLAVELQYWYVVLVLQPRAQQQHYPQQSLTASSSSSLWTLRLPIRMRRLEDSFTAHLYAGAVAPATATSAIDSRLTTTYRLDIVRDPPRPVTSLCLDDDDDGRCLATTAAAAAAMCADVSAATRCARTCGVCNATRPAPCSLDSSWAGVWRDVTAADDVTIHINQTSVSLVVGRQRLVDLHCVSWQQPTIRSKGTASGSSSAANEAMLVTGRNDGCRPHYVCIRLQRRSPSVAFIRYSRAQTWPFDNIASVADSIDCRLFSFETTPGAYLQHQISSAGYNPLIGLLDPTKHWRVLYTADERSPVPCRLPDYVKTSTEATSTTNEFVVSFPGGTRCASGRVDEIQSGLGLRVALSECTHVSNKLALDVGSLSHTAYTCLLSTSLPPVIDNITNKTTNQSPDHVIWTRAQSLFHTSSSVSGVVHCWLFRSASLNSSSISSFHVIDGANCPVELFASQRRRTDESRQRPNALSSQPSTIMFSRSPPVTDHPHASTIDSLSLLNRWQIDTQGDDEDRSLSSHSSRTKYPNDIEQLTQPVNTSDESYDEEESTEVQNSSELVIAVSVIVFIICSYVPCIYRTS
jgi:hypothetical protein